MNKSTNVRKNKSTKDFFTWPPSHCQNLIHLTASALSASPTPNATYYKEGIALVVRTIKSRRRLGLCCAAQEQELLAAIEILEPAELSAEAKKFADELSVNR